MIPLPAPSPRPLVPLLLATALAASLPLPRDGAEDLPTVTVRTSEGQELTGRLAPAQPGRLGLACDGFLEPLVLDPGELARLVVPEPDAEEHARDDGVADLRLLLTTGERLRGRLVAVHADAWRFELVGLGTWDVPVARLLTVDVLSGGPTVHRGPNGLAGWRQSGQDAGAWHASDGGLACDAAGGVLARDFGLHEGRQVHLELGWEGRAGFRVGLGHANQDQLDGEGGVVVEPWGDTLVAFAQREGAVELLELQRELPASGATTLRVRAGAESVEFLDADGERLGELPGQLAGGWLAVTSDAGPLELRALAVLRTLEARPPAVAGDEVLGYTAASGELLLPGGSVELADLTSLRFARADEPVEAAPEGALRLTFSDGRQLVGELVQLGADGLELRTRWAAEPVVCGLEGLALVEVVGGEDAFRRRRSSPSFLETEAGEVAGRLEGITADGAVVWAPTVAEDLATVDRDAVRRIVVNRQTAYFVSSRRFPHFLVLRSGDAFRCTVRSLTDGEVRFESSFGGEHVVPAEAVKAIELDTRRTEDLRTAAAEAPEPEQRFGGWNAPTKRVTDVSAPFDARSLARALTVPRKDARDPDRHLVLARTGDFVRTEVLALGTEAVEVPAPTGGGTRRLRADRVAAIVWLDDSDDAEEADADAGGEPAGAPLARLVLDERTRLTVELEALREGALVARSPVLGRLELDLGQLHAIELAEELLQPGTPYDPWRLERMPEPFPEGRADPPAPRPRVGTVAPEISGVDLEGQPLALSDHLGEVVLLHFWGHW